MQQLGAPLAAAADDRDGARPSGEAFGRLINHSGRRRFASQRVVLYAVLAAQGRGGALAVSRQALATFREAHDALVDISGRGPGVFCDELREAYFGRHAGERTIRDFIALAQRTQDAIERASATVPPLLDQLVDTTTPLLAVLNTITQLYEELAQRHAAAIRHQLAGVMSEIEGIAKQARIVSVNARVAAARAPERGTEFGVVATEFMRVSTRIDELVREAMVASRR
jgi:hypothetical protein